MQDALGARGGGGDGLPGRQQEVPEHRPAAGPRTVRDRIPVARTSGWSGYRAFKRVCHTCCDPADCVRGGGPGPFADEPLPPCPRRARRV
ncbi:MAG: hypothetical protein MZV70_18350 [Desulfobacterales bacterium]|nr:hypothetical protein [Desulfobacterales bacterium]